MMASNVKVVVRVRPLNSKEFNRAVADRVLVEDRKEEILSFFCLDLQEQNKVYLKRANKELKFGFDHVCGPETTNKDVFETTTKDMVSSLMEGYNCSVFAYGATGAGKTFTMIGNNEHSGVTHLTMEHLFHTIHSLEKDREFDVAVSYIEIYNEHVYDLLKPYKIPLQLREDKCVVKVAGLTLSNIKTAQELLDVLDKGNKNRTRHPTDANAESSRSHAVLQVTIQMRYKTSGQVCVSKLSMIDLAGSERVTGAGCGDEHVKEGLNINKSLLSLANCINSLAEGSSHIPYRDSKLTRILKSTLGGSCRTVMIANVSQSVTSYEDTYSTLNFAARANKIQLTIKKNTDDEDLKKKLQAISALAGSLDKTVMASRPKLAPVGDQNSSKVSSQLQQVWRLRVLASSDAHGALEARLLSLMSRARVLALRHRMRVAAHARVAGLAHRCSTDAIDSACTEALPRQERASESYSREALRLDAEVMSVWSKWNQSRRELQATFAQAISICPDLQHEVDSLQAQSRLRLSETTSELRYKLLVIEKQEVNATTQLMSDMPSMLSKLYRLLKKHGRVTPELTEQYTEIMNKAKPALGITWSDTDINIDDPHFQSISNLDLEKPEITHNFHIKIKDPSVTVDIATDGAHLTDIENRDPVERSAAKRRGAAFNLKHNHEEINMSNLKERLDAKALKSTKKVKKEFDSPSFFENVRSLKRDCLNSTLELAGKWDALRNMSNDENKSRAASGAMQSSQRVLVDTGTRTKSYPNLSFGDRGTSAVQRLQMKQKVPLCPLYAFGSSRLRDGTPFQRDVQVGCKAVRARERAARHPYPRPPYARLPQTRPPYAGHAPHVSRGAGDGAPGGCNLDGCTKHKHNRLADARGSAREGVTRPY